MAELPSLHSCLYMQAENERITAKYKRLKEKYTTLSKEKSVPVQNDKGTLPGTSADKNTQTTVKKEETMTEDKQTARLLQTHAALVRKYERELASNTEHSETISNLKMSNTKLETELRTNREKLHKSTTSLEKYKQKTEAMLKNSKEEIFKTSADRDTIKYEYEKLKAEMRGIDKNFFDEVEDLKYALQESAKLNKIYEKTLHSVCRKNKVDFQDALLNTVQKHKNP